MVRGGPSQRVTSSLLRLILFSLRANPLNLQERPGHLKPFTTYQPYDPYLPSPELGAIGGMAVTGASSGIKEEGDEDEEEKDEEKKDN